MIRIPAVATFAILVRFRHISLHCTLLMSTILHKTIDCLLRGSYQLVLNAEGEGKGSKPAANNSMVNAIALFDKEGDLIYMGQSKGTITVLDAVTLKFLDFVKVLALSSIPPCTVTPKSCNAGDNGAKHLGQRLLGHHNDVQ